MAKSQFPKDIMSKKKFHEEWSKLVTGSEDGLPFDPDAPVFSSDVKIPSTTHAYGKKGYEIHVRSGVYYAAYSFMDPEDKTQKEKEILLFSAKSKSLSFPCKFKINDEEREFSEAEFKEIEAMLHNSKRRQSSS